MKNTTFFFHWMRKFRTLSNAGRGNDGGVGGNFHSFSLYVYFGNTVHIKIVQIMHRSCKLILKDDKKIKIQYYTQYNSIVKATKYHATKPIYQIEVETETNRYHE